MSRTNNGSIAELAARLVANGNIINDLMNSNNLVEEIHNSRNGPVRIYEIPLNGPARQERAQRDREQQERLDRQRREREQRWARYPPGDTTVWRDRRTRDQPVASGNINVRPSHDHNNDDPVQQHTVTEGITDQRRPAIVFGQHPPNRQRVRINSNINYDTSDRINEEMEERERQHDNTLEIYRLLVQQYAPDLYDLYQFAVSTMEHVRLNCEISDPCYSCAHGNHSRGIVKLASIVNPTLYEEAKSTFHRGEPTFQTEHFLMTHGFGTESREANDLIFDFSSMISSMFLQRGHLYRNEHAPVYVVIDADGTVYFNGTRKFKLTKHYEPDRGLIFLEKLQRTDSNRHLFETEKKIFNVFREDIWHVLIALLRGKYRMFNAIPELKIPLKRSSSNDNLNANHDRPLSNGLNDTGLVRTIIYNGQPFRNSPKEIRVERPRVVMYGFDGGHRMLLRRRKSKSKPTRLDGTRIDYRDHDANWNDYSPYINYRPVSMSTYIIHNNIDKTLSEDDSNYVEDQ